MNTATNETSNTVVNETKLGQFQPYDAQLPVAEIAGTRIVKCLYKNTAKSEGTDKRHNVFVRIPDYINADLVEDRLPELVDYFVGFLQDTEDAIIKADHKRGVSQIFTDYLTVDKIIDYLEEQETSGRLTKEKIAAWFDAEMLEPLVNAFSEKTDDPAKIEQIITAYQSKFASLAGGRTFIQKQDCESMLKAIEVAGSGATTLGKRFIKRLENMEEKESDMLMSL